MLDTQALLGQGFLEFMIRLHVEGAHLLRWSPEVRAELERKLPVVWPDRKATRIVGLVDAIPSAEIVVTERDLAAAEGHCDPDDMHVLAAGFGGARQAAELERARAVLVTDNLRDFEIDYAKDRGLLILSRDAYGVHIFEDQTARVVRTIDREPEERFQRMLQRMRGDGLTGTADALGRFFAELDL